MTDPVTPNIGLAVPAHGSDIDTWDVPLNGDMTIIDACLGGVTSVALSNAPVGLTTTQTQSATFRFSGTLTAPVTVTLAAVNKAVIVNNACTGAFVITLTTGVGGGRVIGLPPGENVQVFSDGTNIDFMSLERIGTYIDYAGAAVPAWMVACTIPPYLPCVGGTFSAVAYPALAAILGGTTLPDSRASVRIPLDGGSGRVTTAGSGIDGTTRLASGGAQNVTLDVTMIPSHSHTNSVNDPGHQHVAPGAGNAGGANPFALALNNVTTGNISVGPSPQQTGISVSINNTGGGLAHLNMQPSYVGGITMIRAG